MTEVMTTLGFESIGTGFRLMMLLWTAIYSLYAGMAAYEIVTSTTIPSLKTFITKEAPHFLFSGIGALLGIMAFGTNSMELFFLAYLYTIGIGVFLAVVIIKGISEAGWGKFFLLVLHEIGVGRLLTRWVEKIKSM